MPLTPQIVITPVDIVYKSFDITAISYTSSTATYTATGHTLNVGDSVIITGLAPDGYNGTYTITAKATNTFTVANTTNTALTDQVGNVYWADPTEYEYTGGQGVTYFPNNGDVADIIAGDPVIASKIQTYYSLTPPLPPLNVGDLWFDTDDNNKQYRWDGSNWVSVQDGTIATKNRTYYAASAPTGTFVEGDIWFDTSTGNKPYRWVAEKTVSITNKALTSNVATLTTSTTHNFTTGQTVVVSGVDSTFNGTYTLTVTASNQFTYTKVAANVASQASSGTAVQSAFWQSVQDASIATALNAANAAQTTANGKNKVTYSASAPGSTPNTAGDIWWQFSGGTIIGQWTGAGGTSWTSAPIGSAVIANLDAGKITAGTISAAISLEAATITGGSININSGTFVVTNTGAVTITAGSFNINSGTFKVSNTGAITATSGSIAGFTITNSTITNGSTMTLYNNGDFYTGGVVSAGNGLYAQAACSFGSTLDVTGAITGLSTINSNGAANFATAAGTAGQFQVLSTGLLRSLFTYNRQVSTSTRAVLQDNAGNFGNSTSTRRNKHEIQSYKIDSNALLQLDVKTFKYKPELDEDQTTQYGFIAEEAQDLGLDELIQYDSTGIPDYFAYDKLPIFLLQLAQEQEARIKALESK